MSVDHYQVCCICLQDYAETSDEIVTCDLCGMSVHESCYGIHEGSMTSNQSSTSTEPWFCEACVANEFNPTCQLCPNVGGAYKKTDFGLWVHVVCALYTEGVSFHCLDRLEPVTFYHLAWKKWGAKSCVFCEDPQLAVTGCCIGCDAGMCRVHFHPTCAQKLGLLVEDTQAKYRGSAEVVAEPFFAYCKQHALHEQSREKKSNYLRAFSAIHKPKEIGDARIKRKLAELRARKRVVTQPWAIAEKAAKLLNHSPSAVMQLRRKAELMGLDRLRANAASDSVNKSYNPLEFSVSFINYYFEREKKIQSLRSDIQRFQGSIDELKVKNEELPPLAVAMSEESKQKAKENKQTLDQLSELFLVLKFLAAGSGKTGQQKTIETTWSRIESLVSKEDSASVEENSSETRSDIESLAGVTFHTCEGCSSQDDQHLLVKCETCCNYFHLACVQPPLSRMPRKTAYWSWQCHQCQKDSDEDEQEIDLDRPMRLRNSYIRPAPPPPKRRRSANKRKATTTTPASSPKKKLQEEIKAPVVSPKKEKKSPEKKSPKVITPQPSADLQSENARKASPTKHVSDTEIGRIKKEPTLPTNGSSESNIFAQLSKDFGLCVSDKESPKTAARLHCSNISLELDCDSD